MPFIILLGLIVRSSLTLYTFFMGREESLFGPRGGETVAVRGLCNRLSSCSNMKTTPKERRRLICLHRQHRVHSTLAARLFPF